MKDKLKKENNPKAIESIFLKEHLSIFMLCLKMEMEKINLQKSFKKASKKKEKSEYCLVFPYS